MTVTFMQRGIHVVSAASALLIALPGSVNAQLRWPVDAPRITQDYASYNDVSALKYHPGIDITAATSDTNVYAAAEGDVIWVQEGCSAGCNPSACEPPPICDCGVCGCNGGWGNFVLIHHPQLDIWTLYAHLATNQIFVSNSPPQHVQAGFPIARIGATGCVTGTHLHFQILTMFPSEAGDYAIGPFGNYSSDHPASLGFPDPRCYFNHAALTILTNSLNVREKPINGTVFATLNTGQQFVAVAKYPPNSPSPSWWFVYLPNSTSENAGDDVRRYGWIAAQNPDPPYEPYVQINANAPVVWVDGQGVGASPLNIRPESGSCIAAINKAWGGQRFVVLGSSANSCGTGCPEGWWKISLPDINGGDPLYGWVCKTYAKAPYCPSGLRGCSPIIGLNPPSLSPAATLENQSPNNQTFAITNDGGGTLNYTISDNVSWLSVSPSAGATTGSPNVHVVTFNTQGLGEGNYSGTITVIAPDSSNGTATYAVSLTVSELGGPGVLTVTPSSNFSASGNQGGPFSPGGQDYAVENVGGSSMNWTVTNSQPWLSLSNNGGTLLPAEALIVQVTINSNANGLPAGTYVDTIQFTNASNSSGNTSRSVILTVNQAGPPLTITPLDGLSSSGIQGGPFSPSSKTYTLTNNSGGNINWSYSLSPPADWVNPFSGSGSISPGNSYDLVVSVNQNANNLAAGFYQIDAVITDTTNNFTTTRPISLTVNSIPPRPPMVGWTLRASTNPSPRNEHAMIYDLARGAVVMFGGETGAGAISSQTWELGNGVWTWASTGDPSARHAHAMAYDFGRGVSVLFGGSIYGARDGETWEWNGTNWTPRPVTGPSPRSSHAMAYDAARGVTVLFGGSTGPGVYNDETWVWNGTTWTQRAVTGPSARWSHAMAYDPERGVTVLFGGKTVAGANGETWEWDGSSWTQRLGTGPAPRYSTAMSFDAVRGVVVLFGGYDGEYNYNFGDTWEWDGTSWAQRQPTGSPSPRHGHAMAYDSVRGASVLFGGYAGNAYSAETWEWSGTNWRWLPISGPSPRVEHAMVYDAERGTSVVFGGEVGENAISGETWECHSIRLGDLNGDGKLDGLDIQPFVTAVLAGSTDPAEVYIADFTGDSIVDESDLPIFVDALLAQ